MKYTFPKITCTFLLAVGLFSCKKDKDGGTASFLSIIFKFGADSTAITIDNAVKEIKNLPRGCDVTKVAAAAVLPAGYSISPDPSAITDYTKGVTYTVKTNDGKTYTLQINAPAYDAINNPWGIYTPKQLNDIRKGLNESYVLMNDIELPAMSASNSAATTGISDYDLYGWFPIATKYVNNYNNALVIFSGTLDGQNHVIKNLTSLYRGGSQPNGIDAGHNIKINGGLFGYAVHATFKNIGIQLGATGIVERSADETTGLSYVGALVGYADSCVISNCAVTGTGYIKASQHTGGLIGLALNSTVAKCYAAITAPAGFYAISSTYAGGLMGSAFKTDVSDCYAACSILGSVDNGGLIGQFNSGTLKASYASGNVTEFPDNTTGGSLTAYNSLGGLVGALLSTERACKVQNCYATGAVTGASGTNSDFHKKTRIGGLIGQINNLSTSVQVANCYATGEVSRKWISDAAPFLTGGLVGTTSNGVFITGGVCSNYWDKTTTKQTNLGGGNGNLSFDNANTANGKTTAEMKAAATYTSWDFSAVWNVASGTNNGYPYLRSTNK